MDCLAVVSRVGLPPTCSELLYRIFPRLFSILYGSYSLHSKNTASLKHIGIMTVLASSFQVSKVKGKRPFSHRLPYVDFKSSANSRGLRNVHSTWSTSGALAGQNGCDHFTARNTKFCMAFHIPRSGYVDSHCRRKPVQKIL